MKNNGLPAGNHPHTVAYVQPPHGAPKKEKYIKTIKLLFIGLFQTISYETFTVIVFASCACKLKQTVCYPEATQCNTWPKELIRDALVLTAHSSGQSIYSDVGVSSQPPAFRQPIGFLARRRLKYIKG